jgi:uncharacterized RDD family membrane protein YckC
MNDNLDDVPRTEEPLGGPRKSALPPLLIVLGIIALVIVIFMVLTWVQQNT